MAAPEETRTSTYEKQFKLKYGCNPQQKEAHIWAPEGTKLPFKVLSETGKPGYINLLDALNAWQLVSELRKSTNLPAAASFKHVSPAGAAIAAPLSDELRETYGVKADEELSQSALAYIRARNADPKSSFGDFAALSDRVDVDTAKFIKKCVSDGIIAPGYDPEALEILKQKKKGKYIILEADPSYEPPAVEFREVFGVVFSQSRNATLITEENSLQNIVTKNKELSESARLDLILAAISLKYTQSNSVGFALDGQMIGIGAGQQSRVDCVRLAGNKAITWYLRQHPRVKNLKFKAGVKGNDKLNARLQFIEGQFTAPEHKAWSENFEEVPEPLTEDEKSEFLKTFKGVSLSSDAFFPFRDNIDQASQFGVSYILQPGGSVQDSTVIQACDEYGIAMAFNGIRLFHH